MQLSLQKLFSNVDSFLFLVKNFHILQTVEIFMRSRKAMVPMKAIFQRRNVWCHNFHIILTVETVMG